LEENYISFQKRELETEEISNHKHSPIISNKSESKEKDKNVNSHEFGQNS
jgi:hypothetical protein